MRVCTSETGKADVNGRLGAVVGFTRTEDGTSWYYSVHIYYDDLGWCFYERELETVGEFARREDFYDGSAVRVRVDENQRGNLMPPTDER